MLRPSILIALAAVAVGATLAFAPTEVSAQGPAVVTSYYAPQPVVGYYPEVRGLFGRRIVYRPVVSYAAPAVTTVAAPVVSAPVTAYFAPAAPAPVTAYYAPAVPAPVTTYYAPAAPVTTYYAPAPAVAAVPAPVTAYYAPAPVVTYRPAVCP
jgi:hypothetical protein